MRSRYRAWPLIAVLSVAVTGVHSCNATDEEYELERPPGTVRRAALADVGHIA